MSDAQRIVEGVGAMTPLPNTAIKLMTAVGDPTSTMDDIVEAIKYDQAVTSEVLKLCNSAFFGLPRTVTSLHDATVRLGAVKVLQLVMSIHVATPFGHAQVGYGLEPGVLWRHSVAVALASTQIAEQLKMANASLAFTAGLLHDVGKLVLNEHVGGAFAEIVRLVTQERKAFAEAEHEVLGFSHEEVGALVAEKWQLPDALVRCIRYHHSPEDLTPPDPLVDTVYVANCLCLLLGIGVGEDGLYNRASDKVMQRLGLHEQDLEMLGANLMVELQRVEQMFEQFADTSVPTVCAGAKE